MKVFRPADNPVHTMQFIPSDYPAEASVTVNGIEVNASLPVTITDGYAAIEFIYNFTEGEQSEITVGDIYKTKAFATDKSPLENYTINPITNGNVIDL